MIRGSRGPRCISLSLSLVKHDLVAVRILHLENSVRLKLDDRGGDGDPRSAGVGERAVKDAKDLQSCRSF